MRKQVQLRNVKRFERLYSLLVQLYPAPFREEFGDSMKQVFRGQCLDAIEHGHWRLIVFWFRTVCDFAWTCPKEHLIALPTLPARIWQNVLRKPVWFHPTLIAVLAFGLSVLVTLRLPQFYASTVTLEVTPPEYTNDGTTAKFRGGYFIQAEFEKLQSKTVLYPVITNLALTIHYGKLSAKADEPPHELSTEEAYQSLKSNLHITRFKNTKLVELTILDEDKSLATKIANEIGRSYRRWSLEEADDIIRRNVLLAESKQPQDNNRPINPADVKSRLAEIAPNVPVVKVINPAEDAIRPSLPNRPPNIFLGANLSLLVGGVMMLGLWLLKRRQARHSILVAN